MVSMSPKTWQIAAPQKTSWYYQCILHRALELAYLFVDIYKRLEGYAIVHHIFSLLRCTLRWNTRCGMKQFGHKTTVPKWYPETKKTHSKL